MELSKEKMLCIISLYLYLVSLLYTLYLLSSCFSKKKIIIKNKRKNVQRDETRIAKNNILKEKSSRLIFFRTHKTEEAKTQEINKTLVDIKHK